MNLKEKISGHPYLRQTVFSYLLLAITDTLHHLHAATALGQPAALHAAVLGVILIPTAMVMVWLYLCNERVVFIGVFLTIAMLATLVPGIYHGGWDHLIKILAYLRLDGESTEIALLFPNNSWHYWFYEITGVSEFFMAVLCAYFTYKFVVIKFGR